MDLLDLLKNYKMVDPTEDNYNDSYIKIFGKDILDDAKGLAVEEKSEELDAKIKSFVIEAVSNRIRELMRVDNFSILTGAGSSFDVGGVLFGAKQLEESGWVCKLVKEEKLEKEYNFLFKHFNDLYNEKQFGVEDFITFLFKLETAISLGFSLNLEIENIKKVADTNSGNVSIDSVDRPEGMVKNTNNLKVVDIKEIILKGLMNLCKLPKEDKDITNHKTFLKRIISRPINLRRANLFTTNYDLVFEKAMDELGIIYVDGFIGGLKKFFHPESYNFDYYYPASTTEGKVSRMERVLHFYKIHGSLNWVQSEDKSSVNIYGVEKKDIEQDDNVLIYPTPMKEYDTVGFPYSEMFRRFANAIQQPQSCLITFGYSFGDSHINRIILEAATIPSFQLIIISYSWSENIKELVKQFKDEPSIGFIIGEHFGDWEMFATKLIPDLPTEDLEIKYQEKRQNAKKAITKTT